MILGPQAYSILPLIGIKPAQTLRKVVLPEPFAPVTNTDSCSPICSSKQKGSFPAWPTGAPLILTETLFTEGSDGKVKGRGTAFFFRVGKEISVNPLSNNRSSFDAMRILQELARVIKNSSWRNNSKVASLK